jgi:hypothetical protein
MQPTLRWGHSELLVRAQGHTAPLRYPAGSHSHSAGGHAALSSNWAGLIVTGTTFTAVGGGWTVPAVQPSSTFQSSATWVGIGGLPSDPSIVQTGTVQETAGGQTRYFAWYELFPSAPVTIGGVSPGDAMRASILMSSPGVWTLSIADVTSAQHFSSSFSYFGLGGSAEWIEEAPANSSGQIHTLANFGTVYFNNLGVGGTNMSLASTSVVDIASAGGQVIAFPINIDSSTNSFAVTYAPPGPQGSGYDLVGSDGGVFVFPQGQAGGFYGSLPGIGVSVRNIAGMVPSPDNGGYFLVGSDGGVFAFGDAPFEGSLPGLGVGVANIQGIVPTGDNGGYFLVGSDGGVFAFGDAPYLGSLPGLGIRVTNVVGIAATPSDQGYWVVAGDGSVFAFGDAPYLGSASGTPSPVSGISSTPDGGGYRIVTRDGSVYSFGDAGYFGSLPGLAVSPTHPVIGLVPTADNQGYWLIGSDGGIFAFGDAPFVGSLPGLGVTISDIVGAVQTRV